MEILINPNVAYVLMVATVLLLFAVIIIPGTGIPEVAFAICFIASGILAYQLGINIGAVFILIGSIVPFFIAIRYKKTWRIPLVVISILLLIVGSVFLFTHSSGLPLVDPILATVVSIVSGGFIWLSAERAADAVYLAPTHNPNTLIGQIGIARTNIHTEGTVFVGGELWSAKSDEPIEEQRKVYVIKRDGLILTVKEEK